MEEWTTSYLKSLEDKLAVQNTDLSLDQRTSSLKLNATMQNSLHLPTSEHAPKLVLIQPHLQDFELPPAKKLFQTLSSNGTGQAIKTMHSKKTFFLSFSWGYYNIAQ